MSLRFAMLSIRMRIASPPMRPLPSVWCAGGDIWAPGFRRSGGGGVGESNDYAGRLLGGRAQGESTF